MPTVHVSEALLKACEEYKKLDAVNAEKQGELKRAHSEMKAAEVLVDAAEVLLMEKGVEVLEPWQAAKQRHARAESAYDAARLASKNVRQALWMAERAANSFFASDFLGVNVDVNLDDEMISEDSAEADRTLKPSKG